MPLNLPALQRKLDAIAAKDLPGIQALGIRIPFLNEGYTLAELQAWAAKRSDLLNDIRLNRYTDAQIETFRANTYNSLGAADQALADAAIAGGPADLTQASSPSAYDKIVALILYHFVVTAD